MLPQPLLYSRHARVSGISGARQRKKSACDQIPAAMNLTQTFMGMATLAEVFSFRRISTQTTSAANPWRNIHALFQGKMSCNAHGYCVQWS
jgi:hypothetical protein